MDFIAGVDSHKDTHSIVFVDPVGHVVRTLSIPATPGGYAQAIKAAGALPGSVTWGLESTGSYANAFARELLNLGATVYEVPGSFTKRHRKASSRTGKSDPLDAQAIAEAVLRESRRLPCFEVSPEREVLRLRYNQRDRLVRQRTEAINRVRDICMRLGIKGLPRDLWTKRSIAVVRVALSDARYQSDMVTAALADDGGFLLEEIERLSEQIKHLESLMRPFVRRLAPELLDLQGVSTIVAAGLIGHGGSLNNCRDASAFAMRCGTAPVSCSSGKHSSVRVNHGGNRELNRLLFVIAFVQVRTEGHAGRDYYDRKRREGHSHRAALRSLKRQLSNVVYFRLRQAAGRLDRDNASRKQAA